MVSEASAASAHWRAHATDETSWDVSIGAVLGLAVVFMAGLAFYFAITEGQGRLHPDMSEAYAWGREFQFGYHQHPPFWAWLCGLWFLIWPREIWAFGLLSAANSTVGLLGAWAAIGQFARGSGAWPPWRYCC